MNDLNIAHLDQFDNITISTVDFARIVGRQHKHVLKSAESMFNALKIDRLQRGRSYLDEYGREQRCYILTEIDAQHLSIGFDHVKRRQVLMALHELKKSQTSVITRAEYDSLLRRVEDLEANAVYPASAIESTYKWKTLLSMGDLLNLYAPKTRVTAAYKRLIKAGLMAVDDSKRRVLKGEALEYGLNRPSRKFPRFYIDKAEDFAFSILHVY